MSGSSYLVSLVHELRGLPGETEWVEFKVNDENPETLGEYVSALSNSAALNGKAFAYLVWGIEDQTHRVVGTTFSPLSAKKGNEPLETWLLRLLDPKIHFRFHEIDVEGKKVVILEVARAYRHPVRFKGDEFVRIGSAKRALKDAPDRERDLWRIFDQTPFEDLIAVERASADEVLQVLDYSKFFDLLERPPPPNSGSILNALAEDRLIQPCDAGGWNITNLGAILFAKRLEDFHTLERKAVRVIQYRGSGRVDATREQVGTRGYANGFEGLIGFVNGILPSNEVIEKALRKTVPMFPEIAVRELVANALIHQDFLVTGAGPTVEIFEDRIEITNPGKPLVDTNRFLDTPPRSRNETLASLMRRFRICEERGSGIDKVVSQVELFQLPAPLFEAPEGFTKAVLYAHRSLSEMDRAEKIRACYLHACLRYVTMQPMTNRSVRERFGIAEENSALASRLLAEAVEAGAIAIHDPTAGKKSRRYVPFWAASSPKEEEFV